MGSRIPPRVQKVMRHSWPRSFPVAQFPNLPLIVVIFASIVSRLTDGRVQAFASAVFYVGLGVWAWEELVRGVNWFRRLLGAAGLAYVVVRVAEALNR